MYPEEQVEEEEHVLDAADATASHDGVERRCKTDRLSTVKLQKSTYSPAIFTCALFAGFFRPSQQRFGVKLTCSGGDAGERRRWCGPVCTGSAGQSVKKENESDENCDLMLYIFIFLILPD